MVKQYPHSITITIETAATQDDLTGLWTEGTKTEYTFDCRAELNSSGAKVSSSGGVLLDYAYVVYMPLLVIDVPFNSLVVLTMGTKTYSGETKGFYNGQLNTRLWL